MCWNTTENKNTLAIKKNIDLPMQMVNTSKVFLEQVTRMVPCYDMEINSFKEGKHLSKIGWMVSL